MVGLGYEEKMVKRGHILLMSPKCYPDIAGCGIEYAWGYSKQKFLREKNDLVRQNNLHKNVRTSFETVHPVTQKLCLNAKYLLFVILSFHILKMSDKFT